MNKFDHLPSKIYLGGAVCRKCGCEWAIAGTGAKKTVWAKDTPCPRCTEKEKHEVRSK